MTKRPCSKCGAPILPRNRSGLCASCYDHATNNPHKKTYPTKRESVNEETLQGVHLDRFSWWLAKDTEKGLTSYAAKGLSAANATSTLLAIGRA